MISSLVDSICQKKHTCQRFKRYPKRILCKILHITANCTGKENTDLLRLLKNYIFVRFHNLSNVFFSSNFNGYTMWGIRTQRKGKHFGNIFNSRSRVMSFNNSENCNVSSFRTLSSVVSSVFYSKTHTQCLKLHNVHRIWAVSHLPFYSYTSFHLRNIKSRAGTPVSQDRFFFILFLDYLFEMILKVNIDI